MNPGRESGAGGATALLLPRLLGLRAESSFKILKSSCFSLASNTSLGFSSLVSVFEESSDFMAASCSSREYARRVVSVSMVGTRTQFLVNDARRVDALMAEQGTSRWAGLGGMAVFVFFLSVCLAIIERTAGIALIPGTIAATEEVPTALILFAMLEISLAFSAFVASLGEEGS